MIGAWIDELERDLGLGAKLRLLANCGGQRREVSSVAHAEHSRLATEAGADVTLWLAARFAGGPVDVPSAGAQSARDRASELRAAVLEAGLTHPRRSANDIAREFGVTSMWVRKLRSELRADRQMRLPLFDHYDQD